LTDANSNPELSLVRVQRKLIESSVKLIDISYSGKFLHDVGSAEFSREKIAMEVTGTISDEGVFLFTPNADSIPPLLKTFPTSKQS